MHLRSTLALLVASLFAPSPASADPAIEPLAGFDMGPGNPGGAPLYLHSDGHFYATSAVGGAVGYQNFSPVRNGYGTIYQVKSSGEISALSFGIIPGDTPNPTLVPSADGWLWGSTTKGALAEGNGTVFRFQPETGTFQKMYDVAGGGTNPVSNLVRDPATGRLWGTAGATTFSIHEITGQYTAGGVAPVSATSEVNDGAGFAWGVTTTGTHGTIYKREISSGTVTTVITLTGTTGSFLGTTPLGPLVKDGNFMWGTTSSGGTGTSPGLGTVFKVDITSNAYTAVVRFGSLTGSNAGLRSPSNALAADGKGYLWGIASQGGANGVNGWSVYKVKISDGSVLRVSEFGPGTNNTTFAFNNAAAARGRMPFKGLTGNATSPYLWGTTSEGGTKGFGTLFRYDPTMDRYEVMANFSGTTGTALGGRPNGRLMIDGNGVVWGTTEIGGNGTNFGTVFKFDPSTRVFTTIHSFNLGGNGGYPRAGLVDGGDGYLYGTASASPNGVIYRIDKSTSALGIVHAFNTVSEGSSPEGELLPDGAGSLWGTTTVGGTSSNGVLFKFTPSTLTYAAVVKFTGTTTAPQGRQPSGPLVMDASGAIWGTTTSTVFKYDPAGAGTFTNIFSNVEIGTPLKSVYVGTISKTAAGTIRFLGTEDTQDITPRSSLRAVIYDINATTNVVTRVRSLFEGGADNGSNLNFAPAGGLYEHSDGRFYGLTKSGGTDEDQSVAGGGMLYRVSTGPAVATQSFSFSPLAWRTLVNNSTTNLFATLRGFANPNGNSIICEFEWGPTTALGNTASASVSTGVGGSGFVGSIYQAIINNLTPQTTYFYRLVAKTTTGDPSYGPILSFQTGTPVPAATPEISVESPIGQVLADNVGSVNLGSLRVGQAVKQSFVVRNLGGAVDLTGLSASVGGTHADDFVITTPLPVNSLPQTSTGLMITFTPSAAGQRSATLIITSSDSDEASFEVPLSGEGLVEPDIQIETFQATTLDDGEGFYDFGSIATGAPLERPFTLRNIGNAALNNLNITVEGDHQDDFVVTTQPPESINGGASSSFLITFTPSFGGLRVARLRIQSSDDDENPFYMDVSGTGIAAPEITVTESGAGLTDNVSTLNFGTANTGTTQSKTITITNSGSATLSGISLSVVGLQADDFIPGNVASSVLPGNQTSFTISFIPLSTGPRFATLRIASNDSNENPFDIALNGTGETSSVSRLGLTKTRFHDQTGTATTTLKDFSMSAFLSGTGVSSTFPSTNNRFTRSGGSPTTLTFDFDGWYSESFYPTLTALNTAYPNGAYSFLVGSDAVPLTFTADSYPVVPVITSSAGVWVNGRLQITPAQAAAGFNLLSNVSDGDGFLTLDVFSNATDVASDVVTSNPLHNQRLDLDVPPGSMQVGQIYTVEAEFDDVVGTTAITTPSWAASGAQGFALFSSRTVFEVVVVESAPEIAVEQPPPNAPASLIDGTSSIDFGILNPGVTGAAKVFTVKNEGLAPLTLGAITVDGAHADDFAVNSSSLGTTVAPNSSTTFSVTFTPGALGSRSATLHLANDDANESSFDIALTGTGQSFPQAPQFTVQPRSQLLLLGQAASFTTTVIGDLPMTLQWKKATANVNGANLSSYGIALTKATDVAAYSLVADNPVGAPVTSQPAYLGLVTPTTGTQTLKVGTTLTLTAKVSAPAATGVRLLYRWFHDDEPLSNTIPAVANQPVISGADKATLSITKLTTAMAGSYTCQVTLDTPFNDPTCFIGDTELIVVDALPVMAPIQLNSVVSVSQFLDVLVSASHYPTSYSLTGLPAGMKFDAKTGRLSGKPTTPSLKDKGVYKPNKLFFRATNAFGTGPALEFLLTIQDLDPSFVGTFHGIVEREPYSNFNMGGVMQVTVASTGVISGSATLAGQKHSIVGALDASIGNPPTALITVKRTPATLGDLTLDLNIVPNGNLMQGDLWDPTFKALIGSQDLGDPEQAGFANGPHEDALFDSPRGVVVVPNSENGYIADTGNHVIRYVDAVSGISTFAGTAETEGSADGLGTEASFEFPEGLARDAAGNLYVADTGNATIRKITPQGQVTTLAGSADQTGSTNGTGTAARFEQPCALCLDPLGNLYVVDRGNHTVRKITPAGVVTTLAGKANAPAYKDGSGIAAQFNAPSGITYDPFFKALFVTDTQNFVIRRITLTGAVTTYAGAGGVEGADDGLLLNARFAEPLGITSLGDGTLIVGDRVLRQISRSGVVGTVAEVVDAVVGGDHPVAISYQPSDGVLITAHDTLHGITSHSVSGQVQKAYFEAQRQAWTSVVTVPTTEQGLYNSALLTSALPGDGNLPQGDGYAQLTLSKNGTASWTGKTSDGVGFTFSTVMALDRKIPLHAMMYRNTGSLQGRAFVDSGTLDLVNHSVPALDWYKIAQPLPTVDRAYKGGFILHPLNLLGGKYTPPNHLFNFFGLLTSPGTLTLNFSEAGLSLPPVSFTLTTPNTVKVLANANSAALNLSAATGLFTGSFKTGSPAVQSNFAGLVLKNVGASAVRGYGHVLVPASTSATSPLSSGRIRIEK